VSCGEWRQPSGGTGGSERQGARREGGGLREVGGRTGGRKGGGRGGWRRRSKEGEGLRKKGGDDRFRWGRDGGRDRM